MENTLPNKAIQWQRGQLTLLDQRKLPGQIEFLTIDTLSGVYNAIKEMVVRGAPAIGITAAYGVVLSAKHHQHSLSARAISKIEADINMLNRARPTAVNLQWALQRMHDCLLNDPDNRLSALEREACLIHAEDIAANKAMGQLGAAYINNNCNVMTHCNAGALATGGYGTALGVIRSAFAQGKINSVFANETRPWFQGARLTSWELQQDNIPVNLICDSAAASALQAHHVEWVIVGADRIAANGDVANKIGTYGLAVLAKYTHKKFMVVAPTSTIDRASASGREVAIEERGEEEVTHVTNKMIAASGIGVWNPVFDITPAALIDVLVTERGTVENPNREKIDQLFTN